VGTNPPPSRPTLPTIVGHVCANSVPNSLGRPGLPNCQCFPPAAAGDMRGRGSETLSVR
jgi:hypothetical protein